MVTALGRTFTLLLVSHVLFPSASAADTIEPMEPIAATYSEPLNITCLASLTSTFEGVRLKKVIPPDNFKNIYSLIPPDYADDKALDTSKYSAIRIDKHSFIITVLSSRFEDATRYRCGLIFQDTIAERTTVVILREPTLHGKDNLLAGERAEFSCDANYQTPVDLDKDTEADLYPQITATIGGTVQTGHITRYPEGRITLTWNVTSLSPQDDQKDVVCEVLTARPIHSAYKVKRLNIMYKAQNIAIIPKLDIYSVGEKINCTAQGNPLPKTRWEGVKTNAGINVGPQLLIVSNMMGDEPEVWKCIASNMLAGKLEQIESIITFSVVRGTEPPVDESKPSPTAAIAVGATVGTIALVIAITVLVILIIRRRRPGEKDYVSEEAIATGPFSDIEHCKPPASNPDMPAPTVHKSKPNSNGQNVGFASSLATGDVNEPDDSQAELVKRTLTPNPVDDVHADAEDWRYRKDPQLPSVTANVALLNDNARHAYQGAPHPTGGYPQKTEQLPKVPVATEYPNIVAAHPGLQRAYNMPHAVSHQPPNPPLDTAV